MAKRVTGNISLPTKTSPSISTVFAARVREIILDNQSNPEIFKENGEWSSIGTIFFSLINTSNTSQNPYLSDKAYPLFPNQKIYPLKNEIVYIISLPTPGIQSATNSQRYYYFQPVNIWSNNHHNAIPDPTNTPLTPNSQQQDYIETEAGIVRRVTDGGTEIDLGTTFKENLKIKTIQPFEGDIIHEGRWGQSLRFGSTVKNSKIFNTWSRTGDNGDPITILRNAQFDDGEDPWIPQVEDINKEGSAIYFTSTQAIPIEVSSKSYKSYSSPPTSPDKFAGEQIILNSGRLVFNSKEDSILFSSKKTINLNAVDSVNIDAPKTILQSDEVYLGDKNASEPVILGNKFLTDMSKLLTQLIALGTALQVPVGTPVPFVPHPAIPVPAVNVTQTATEMLNKIQTYKSKVSKTK
jgi:hypothetical protein